MLKTKLLIGFAVLVAGYWSVIMLSKSFSSNPSGETKPESIAQPPPVIPKEKEAMGKVFPPSPLSIPVGKVFDLKAAIPDGTNYAWAVPPDQPGLEFRSSGLSGYLFPQSTGTFHVGMAYGNPIQLVWVVVMVSGTPNNPQPSPTPNANPPPPGEKSTGPFQLIVVYDKIPVLPPFPGGMPLADFMLAKGHTWKLVDRIGKDSRGNLIVDPAKIPEAFKTSAVYLIIADGNKFQSVQPLPAAQEDVIRLLRMAEQQ